MLHVSPGQTQPVFPSDCIFFCFLSHVKTYVDVYILPMLHFPGRRYRLAAARKTEQENGYGSQNHPPFWGFLLALVAMEKVVGLFEPFTWYGSLQLLEMELRLYPWASLSYSLHKRATVGGDTAVPPRLRQYLWPMLLLFQIHKFTQDEILV